MIHLYFELICISCLLLAGCYAFLVIHISNIWEKIPEFKSVAGTTSITVIIPARNEEQTILTCLHHLSKQNYPRNLFEILVVDDGSEDKTAILVRKFILENKEISVELIDLQSLNQDGTSLNQDGTTPLTQLKFSPLQGKKAAIKAAISSSNSTLIATVDADCIMGVDWMPTLAAFYEQFHSAMIVGPVAMAGRDYGIQLLQIQEMICLSAFTGVFCYRGNPIMCNGANLAYEREAFIQAGGFQGIDQLASGDDVLLMNKFKHHFPTRVNYLKARAAIVYTKALVHLSEFIPQRIRWLTKSKSNSNPVSFLTGLLISGLSLVLLASLLFSFFYGKFATVFLVLFGIKFLADLQLLRTTAVFFDREIQGIRVFATALLYPFYVLLILLLSMRTRYEWKGRKVR